MAPLNRVVLRSRAALARSCFDYHLKNLSATLLLGLTLVCQAQPSPETDPVQWVFLNTGPARDKLKSMPKDEVNQMQAAHVGNFGTLFNEGRLLAAGPLGDNGWIRGIVMLSPATEAKARECFAQDPFVRGGFLDVEMHPWRVDVMKFGVPKRPFQISLYTLAIVKKGTNWGKAKANLTEQAMLDMFPSLKPKARSGELAISGPFLDQGDKLGVLLFHSTNHTAILAEFQHEPAFATGRVDVELHPQYLGDGTFRSPPDAATPPAGKRTRLFDGKSFGGWEGDTQRTWRIASGALVGGDLAQTVPHNAFLCTTRSYTNFDLRLEVKLTGTGFVNGGIQFRSQRCQDPAYEMTGYQADMGEGYWGSLYDESRRNKTLAHTHAAVIHRILKPNDWNQYIIRCEDHHIRLWLNGVLTVDYTEDDSSIPMSGLLGLQIHGGGKAEASYRNITIAELP